MLKRMGSFTWKWFKGLLYYFVMFPIGLYCVARGWHGNFTFGFTLDQKGGE